MIQSLAVIIRKIRQISSSLVSMSHHNTKLLYYMACSAVPIVCLMRLVSQRLGYRVGRLSPDPTKFLEKTKTWPKRV